jgi:hypothetical protein
MQTLSNQFQSGVKHRPNINQRAYRKLLNSIPMTIVLLQSLQKFLRQYAASAELTRFQTSTISPTRMI